MNVKKRLFVVVFGLTMVALSILAFPSTRPFRATAFFYGFTQGTNEVTGLPAMDSANFAGWNLVNLAMGRSATDTSETNQFLAFRIVCDTNPTTADLIVSGRTFFYTTNFVYDSRTNVVGTNIVAHPFFQPINVISTGTNFNSFEERDADRASGNRARFVVEFPINACGDATNGLAGGFLTVAGHLHLFLTNGCPDMVLLSLDRDPLDRLSGTKEVSERIDPDPLNIPFRTGLGHVIGVLDVVNDGVTNRVLIPHGNLSIRRPLR